MWVFLGSSAHAVKWFATKELIIGKDHKEEIRMTYIPKHSSSLLCVLSFSTSDLSDQGSAVCILYMHVHEYKSMHIYNVFVFILPLDECMTLSVSRPL